MASRDESACTECGTTNHTHGRGCLELARIQRDQLRAWRDERGGTLPSHWGPRVAEIGRQLGEPV